MELTSSTGESPDSHGERSDGVPASVARAIRILQAFARGSGGSFGEDEQWALETLYRRYRRLVYATVGAVLGWGHEIDDVAHDVFWHLPNKLRSYRPGNFEGWLGTIAAREALRHLRRIGRYRARDLKAIEMIGDDAVVDADLVALEDLRRLRQAIQRLPETLRVVVALHGQLGLPHAEVAAVLGIKPSAAMVRYSRAVARLRRDLRD